MMIQTLITMKSMLFAKKQSQINEYPYSGKTNGTIKIMEIRYDGKPL